VALAALAVAGLGRLEVDTGVTSLLPAGDPAVRAWEDTQVSFGGDPVVVLFSGRGGGDLLEPDPVHRLVALERALADLPDVAVVYGPGTTLNQIAIQINELLVSITAQRDGLRAQAEEAARARGASEEEAVAEGRAAVADFEARYGSLVAAGLPLGLPSLSNPGFARSVFLDREGRARPPLRWIVPDDEHAAVYVRPREGLDQRGTDRLVGAVRARVRRAGIGTGVTVSGAPVLVSSLGREVRRELPRLGLVALLAVALAFFASHRVRGWRRFTPLALGLVATGATLAGFGLLGTPLSLGMLAFLPVMLGVGTDLPIQAAHPARRRTLAAAAVAGAAAFAALALSPLPFVRHLGLALAVGVLASAALARAAGTRGVDDLVRAAPSRPAGRGGRAQPAGRGGRAQPAGRGGRAQPAGRGGRAQPAGRGGKAQPTGRGGKAQPTGRGGKARRVASSNGHRAVLAVAAALAAAGWALLPTLPVEARPERLAEGLPALGEARQVERVLGASGEVAVRVRAGDVTSPAMLAWFREAEERLVVRFGDRLRPIVSPGRLLSWLGPEPTPSQVDAALEILPRYLTGASVRADRREAVASYGLRLGDLAKQARLLAAVEAALPPAPAGTEVELTGLPVVAARGYDLLSGGRLAASLAGPLLAGAALLLLLPRRRHALAAVAASLMAVGWGVLALRVAGIGLNPLTVGLGSLTAAVGAEFTVFALERQAAGLRRPWPGVVAAGVTSAAGFATLAASRLDVLAEFGLVLAGSVLLALLAARVLVGRPAAVAGPASSPDPLETPTPATMAR
jgi:hypothetical protein